jgi:hypothetical protein
MPFASNQLQNSQNLLINFTEIPTALPCLVDIEAQKML